MYPYFHNDLIYIDAKNDYFLVILQACNVGISNISLVWETGVKFALADVTMDSKSTHAW